MPSIFKYWQAGGGQPNEQQGNLEKLEATLNQNWIPTDYSDLKIKQFQVPRRLNEQLFLYTFWMDQLKLFANKTSGYTEWKLACWCLQSGNNHQFFRYFIRGFSKIFLNKKSESQNGFQKTCFDVAPGSYCWWKELCTTWDV